MGRSLNLGERMGATSGDRLSSSCLVPFVSSLCSSLPLPPLSRGAGSGCQRRDDKHRSCRRLSRHRVYIGCAWGSRPGALCIDTPNIGTAQVRTHGALVVLLFRIAATIGAACGGASPGTSQRLPWLSELQVGVPNTSQARHMHTHLPHHRTRLYLAAQLLSSAPGLA